MLLVTMVMVVMTSQIVECEDRPRSKRSADDMMMMLMTGSAVNYFQLEEFYNNTEMVEQEEVLVMKRADNVSIVRGRLVVRKSTKTYTALHCTVYI